MFSKGQLTFTLIFFILFVVGIYFAYRKDKKGNTQFFKGSYKILLFIIFFLSALFAVVKLKLLAK